MNTTTPGSVPQRRPRLRTWLIFLALIAVAAVVIAYYVQTRTVPRNVAEDVRNVMGGLGNPPYRDPAGRFTIVPPAGWFVQHSLDEPGYDVSFASLFGAAIHLQATPVRYNDLPSLNKDIQKREKDFGISTVVDTARFQERQAIRRTANLADRKVLAYDFVENRVAYHILCEIPNGFAKEYDPVIDAVLKTFRTAAAAQ